MSLDDDLPPRVLHDRDKDACQPTWVRMALRQREAEVAEAKRKADELAAIESPEAEAAKWSRIFRQMAAEREPVHYRETRLGIDDRLWGP